MWLPFFCLWNSSLFSFSISDAPCFLNWYFMVASIKRHSSRKYNPYRRLNFCCMKSRNIRLNFIASSFRTSMSYFYQLRSILYCSKNSSLFAILMHGLWIPKGFVFLDEGKIHFSCSTSAKQYRSLTFVRYQKIYICLQQLEWE